MNTLSTLYQDAIRRHSTHPVGFRRQIDATHQNECYNPQCGDRVLVRLQIHDGRVEATAFDGAACAICMASASMLCELLVEEPVARIEALRERLRAALEDGADLDDLDTLKPLLGVKPYPSRIRCATLPWEAASGAL